MSPEDRRALLHARAQTATLVDQRREAAARRRQQLGMQPLRSSRTVGGGWLSRHLVLSAVLLALVAAALLTGALAAPFEL